LKTSAPEAILKKGTGSCFDKRIQGSIDQKKQGFEGSLTKPPGFEGSLTKPPGFEASLAKPTGFEGSLNKSPGFEGSLTKKARQWRAYDF